MPRRLLPIRYAAGAMPGEEHELMAQALEQEARLRDQGEFRQIGAAYDPTYGQILEINSDYDEAIGFAFTFWDNWVDASNHDWQYHEPISQHDWPRFAREIAEAVRNGALPSNEFLVDQIRLKPRVSLWQRFKALFTSAA